MGTCYQNNRSQSSVQRRPCGVRDKGTALKRQEQLAASAHSARKARREENAGQSFHFVPV